MNLKRCALGTAQPVQAQGDAAPPESAKDNNDEGPSSSESDFSLSSETQPLRRELSTGSTRRPLPELHPH